MDCMEGLKNTPDKFYDLAIVDPPYGIGMSSYKRNGDIKFDMAKDWDASPPSLRYFNELRRVSKNQIIFGGNYFTDKLPISKGWLFWDKKQNGNLQIGELAWTSFDRIVYYERIWQLDRNWQLEKIHPTQKPTPLYKWILKNYAKAGDLILDTHVGSASSLIACKELGFDYVGFEIDKDYYEAASKRLARAFRKYELNFE